AHSLSFGRILFRCSSTFRFEGFYVSRQLNGNEDDAGALPSRQKYCGKRSLRWI
ncbi:MAG: hypothetical protein, partial [Olavius algarvensis spirochete endosymbiont]